MDLVYLVLNPRYHYYDRFDQSLLEYQEISARIQESTFSVHNVEFDPDVKVSCQNPLKCQNSEVLSEWDQFYESSSLHSSFLHSSFNFVFEGLS